MESVGSPEYKSQNEILSHELKDVFERILPEELKVATGIDVVSVASGHFVQELLGINTVIPGIREFRAIDLNIPEGLLKILNERMSGFPGARIENGDVSKPEVLGASKYDLAILRNPQVGSLSDPGTVNSTWQRIIENTLNCVKPGGYLVLSGHIPEEFAVAMGYIKQTGGGFEVLKQEDPITPSLKAETPMKESSIAVLRRPIAPVVSSPSK